MSDETRAEAFDRFNRLTEINQLGLAVTGITYAGHERETTRYTFTFSDGRTLRLTDRKLWSPVEFEREVTVKLRIPFQTGEHAKWRTAIKALLIHAAEEIVLEGEGFTDVVREWIGDYARHVLSVTTPESRAEAAAASAPYVEDAKLNVHAGHLLRYIRREKEEKVQRGDLFQALRDLGFERITVGYTQRVNGSGSTSRHSTSYYRCPLRDIQPLAESANVSPTTTDSDVL